MRLLAHISDNANVNSLDRKLIPLEVHFNRLKIGILGKQFDGISRSFQPLQCYFISNSRCDNLAGSRLWSAMYGHQVTIENANIPHARAFHAQQVICPWLEKYRVKPVMGFNVLRAQDRTACGDSSDHRQPTSADWHDAPSLVRLYRYSTFGDERVDVLVYRVNRGKSELRLNFVS